MPAQAAGSTSGDGHKLYLLEKGSGGPTVLFEAGIAATNLNWFHIQETVAQFTGTASYDRGGLGWSSPCRTARTPGNIAAELHDMLQQAGIKPPYILVGHSFGGLVMRRFALLYPEEVASVRAGRPHALRGMAAAEPRQAIASSIVARSSPALPFRLRASASRAWLSLRCFCRSGRICRALAGAAGNGGRHVLGRVTDEVGKMPRRSGPSSPPTGRAPATTPACAAMSRRCPIRCARCMLPSRFTIFPCWC